VVGGPYSIGVTNAVGDDGLTNYLITYVPGTLTVGKKDLQVQADNKSRVYGQANPTLTISYSGFITGEGASNLDSLPTASTTATPTSVPGVYTITVTGGTSSNYLLHYIDGTFTIIAPGPLTLSITQNHELTGTGDMNVTYTIQASSDLVHWSDIGSATTDENGQFEYHDEDADNFVARFYRTVLK
jgi:hypothetical protein